MNISVFIDWLWNKWFNNDLNKEIWNYIILSFLMGNSVWLIANLYKKENEVNPIIPIIIYLVMILMFAYKDYIDKKFMVIKNDL